MRKTETLKDALKAGRHDAVLAGIRSDEHGIRSKERYFSPRDKGFRWNVFRRKRGASGDSAFSPMQDAELSGWNIFATEFGKETSHVRVHPLLHWTELDVWEYVKKEKIPVVPLYFARNGKRFRSIGCKCCCSPVESNARNISDIIAELKATNLPERAGRAQDKESEHMMERLRALGYM